MNDSVNEYDLIRPTFERFQLKLTELIKELLEESNIEVVSIEGRTKTVESFKEKINRPGKKYINPIKDMTDLCGIRIITYYTEDIYKISELIENEFFIDKENSIDKTKVNNPDQFGYQSVHYIMSIGKKRDKLTEWKLVKSLFAEIQIRSILQHSWAAIDHKLRYKTKGEIPSKLKRKIYRLSALLELADEEFLSLKNETNKLNLEIETSINHDNLNLEFNILSLVSYLENNQKIKEITVKAINLGFREYSIQVSDLDNIYVSQLIEVLRYSDLHTLKDLDDFLNSINKLASHNLKLFIDIFEKESEEEIYAVEPDLIIILIALSKRIDINSVEIKKAITWVPMLNTLIKLART